MYHGETSLVPVISDVAVPGRKRSGHAWMFVVVCACLSNVCPIDLCMADDESPMIKLLNVGRVSSEHGFTTQETIVMHS